MCRHFLNILTVLLLAMPLSAAPIYTESLIFPLQEKHVHSSSVVECPNGDLLACWFHGSGERQSLDVLVQGARLKKGAAAWSPVFLMADTPNLPDCNPVLYIDAQQELWLFWIAVLAESWEDSLLRYRKAKDYQGDGAPNWYWQDDMILDPGKDFPDQLKTGFEEVIPTLPGKDTAVGRWLRHDIRRIERDARNLSKRQRGWMTRAQIITLPSGRILVPLYSDGYLLGLMAISDDTGASWRPSAPIVGAGLNQPSLARKQDGTLVAYMREEDEIKRRVLTSVSHDDGETWSVAQSTDIPNPNSSLAVLTLDDGRWVMAYNDSEDTRETLALALSDDEGATWKWQRHLELQKGGQFHYPFMIQTSDGLVHVTYTYQPAGDAGRSIKHVTLNPEWILAGDESK